jgi:F-type H+-transporting ATPase subunit epsilon
MSVMSLVIVTPERVVYSGDVEAVVAPGTEGELGILPHHAPLITILQHGELRVRTGVDEFCLAIFGGYLEVRPDRVIILADAAERAEEIDIARAEEAGHRAERALQDRQASGVDKSQAEAELRRSLVRLRVVDQKRKRKAIVS